MEKQKVPVRVGGKSYTMVSSDPPEHITFLADNAVIDQIIDPDGDIVYEREI